MGSNSSKAHGKVTRVAPLPCKEEPQQPPGSGAVQGFQRPLQGWSASPFAPAMERTPVWERPLPPLRETWLGRYPAVPRPIPLDRLEAREVSIIKQHPPRRFQKLEPLVLAKDSPLDKSWNLPSHTRIDQDDDASVYFLLFMVTLEGAREERARLEPHSGEPAALPQDEDAGNEARGHLWDEDPCQVRGSSRSPPGQDGNVERWLLKQQARRESFWDTSSSDSETWGGDVGKPFRRPALVRTKAERIPLFDEFFDKEF
ncbi:hypothetical protein lerEdw1_010934 [Lerista edwardsae]|nr:hypothetical protein lerEdw1_010934 [Lerista edwardsae]